MLTMRGRSRRVPVSRSGSAVLPFPPNAIMIAMRGRVNPRPGTLAVIPPVSAAADRQHRTNRSSAPAPGTGKHRLRLAFHTRA
jgi:hypothetical protein